MVRTKIALPREYVTGIEILAAARGVPNSVVYREAIATYLGMKIVDTAETVATTTVLAADLAEHRANPWRRYRSAATHRSEPALRGKEG